MLTFIFVFLASEVFAGPQSLSYQGRILDSSGNPMESSSVQFRFTLLSPDNLCELWTETKSAIDMTSSGGIFDVTVGPSAGLATALENSTNHTCLNLGNYTGAVTAGRKLKVEFNPGNTGWREITPNLDINSVPYAAVASKLGNRTAADFIARPGTCSTGQSVYFDGSNFVCQALTATDIPNIDAGKIVSGTLTRDVLATNVSATTGQFTNLRIYDGVGQFITMNYPSAGASSYAITWPATQGGANTYLQNDGAGNLTWSAAGGGSGTVTNVTSTNAYLSIATGASTPAITANVGTTINTLAAGDDARFTNARTPTGAAGGDLSGTYPNPSVAQIQGQPVDSAAPTATGQALLWDGAKWHANFIRAQDLRNIWGGDQMIPDGVCSADEAMIWSAVSDRFTCQTIGSLNASAISAGTLNTARLGSGTADATTFLRGDGTWAAAGSNPNSILNNGNSFGVPIVIGSNDSQPLHLETNGTNKLTVLSGGNIGVGLENPATKFEVAGTMRATGSSVPTAGSGPGLELSYWAGGSYVNSRDATTGLNDDLYIIGSYIYFAADPSGYAADMILSPTGELTVNSYEVPTTKFEVGAYSTTGNTVIPAMKILRADTDSAAGNGIGTGLLFATETATNFQMRDIAGIDAALDDAADSSKDASIRFKVVGPNASGAVAPSEKMRLDSDGDLGIGVTNPLYSLDVRSTGDVARLHHDSNSLLLLSTTNVGSRSGVTLLGNAGANPWQMVAQGGSTLTFKPTQNINDGAAISALTLTSSGNVGMGNISPTTVLDINGAVTHRGMAVPDVAPAGQGRIYFDSTSNKFRVSQNTGAYSDLVGAAGAASLSSLTAATSSNTINNGNNQQNWEFGNLGGITGLSLSSPTLVNGTIFKVSTTSGTASQGRLVEIDNQGNNWIIPLVITNASGMPALRINDDGTQADATPFLIDADGRVGIGTETPAQKLDVNGTIRAVDIILTSDRRAKENISTLDQQSSLQKICKINPVQFEWIESGREDLGVIAQEIEKVYPQLVITNPDGSKSVKYHSLIAPLISSVQSLNRTDQSLKAENQRIREENQKLKQELDQLKKVQAEILNSIDQLKKRMPASSQ